MRRTWLRHIRVLWARIRKVLWLSPIRAKSKISLSFMRISLLLQFKRRRILRYLHLQITMIVYSKEDLVLAMLATFQMKTKLSMTWTLNKSGRERQSTAWAHKVLYLLIKDKLEEKSIIRMLTTKTLSRLNTPKK